MQAPGWNGNMLYHTAVMTSVLQVILPVTKKSTGWVIFVSSKGRWSFPNICPGFYRHPREVLNPHFLMDAINNAVGFLLVVAKIPKLAQRRKSDVVNIILESPLLLSFSR